MQAQVMLMCMPSAAGDVAVPIGGKKAAGDLNFTDAASRPVLLSIHTR